MKKTAVITGGSGGIGLAASSVFVQAGWDVIALDVRAPAEVYPGVEFHQIDVSDPTAVEQFYANLAGSIDKVHALVNNAAIQICKPLVKMTVDEWDKIMNVNLRAAFLMVKWGYPLLKEGKGAIVNVSSVHAVATSVEMAAYAASKGGLAALTRAMALEFAADGVRANALLPGAVDTEMLRDGLNRGHVSGDSIDERLLDLGRRTVMGRVGLPEELARAIYFMADAEQSAFMTGQTMTVDGGATARLSTE